LERGEEGSVRIYEPQNLRDKKDAKKVSDAVKRAEEREAAAREAKADADLNQIISVMTPFEKEDLANRIEESQAAQGLKAGQSPASSMLG